MFVFLQVRDLFRLNSRAFLFEDYRCKNSGHRNDDGKIRGVTRVGVLLIVVIIVIVIIVVVSALGVRTGAVTSSALPVVRAKKLTTLESLVIARIYNVSISAVPAMVISKPAVEWPLS